VIPLFFLFSLSPCLCFVFAACRLLLAGGRLSCVVGLVPLIICIFVENVGR